MIYWGRRKWGQKTFSHSADIVWNALLHVAGNLDNMRTIQKDAANKRLVVSFADSSLTYGENVEITVDSISESLSRVRVTGEYRFIRKGYLADKYRINVDNVLRELSNTLEAEK